MTTFVEFKLDAGGEIWIDAEKVKAVTSAVEGGSRLWVGGGDFFEVAAPVAEVMATIRGGRRDGDTDNVHVLPPRVVS
ncbi:MAG: hypothetical protein ACM3W4_11845 [Ignavibacteriales bacterium]